MEYVVSEARVLMARRIQAWCTYDKYTRIREEQLRGDPRARDELYQEEDLLWVVNKLKKEDYIDSYVETDEFDNKFYRIKLCLKGEKPDKTRDTPQRTGQKTPKNSFLGGAGILLFFLSLLAFLLLGTR